MCHRNSQAVRKTHTT